MSKQSKNNRLSDWHFSCESKPSIPLPPKYTFPQAFNYLNSKNNSFYILTSPNNDYIQCGGGRSKCMVEIRKQNETGYSHFVIGKDKEPGELVEIQMSHGPVKVYQNEILTRWNAIDLFDAFFKGQSINASFKLRRIKI